MRRFLQVKKFSYQIRFLFDVVNINDENVIASNRKVYAKLLKSVLLEHFISICFIVIVVYQILFYMNLEKEANRLIKAEKLMSDYSSSPSKHENMIISSRLFGNAFARKETIGLVIDYVNNGLTDTLKRFKSKLSIKNTTLKTLLYFKNNSRTLLEFNEANLKSGFSMLLDSTKQLWNVCMLFEYHNQRFNYLYRVEFNIKDQNNRTVLIIPDYQKFNQFTFEYISLLCVLTIFTVYYIIEEFIELFIYRLKYFELFLNWIDIFIVVFLIKHILECCFIDIKVSLRRNYRIFIIMLTLLFE